MRTVNIVSILGTANTNGTLQNSVTDFDLNGGKMCLLKKVMVGVALPSGGVDVLKTLRANGFIYLNGINIPFSENNGQIELDIEATKITASISLSIEFLTPIGSDLDYMCSMIAFIE